MVWTREVLEITETIPGPGRSQSQRVRLRTRQIPRDLFVVVVKGPGGDLRGAGFHLAEEEE